MKGFIKKTLSIILCFTMVFTMLHGTMLSASAKVVGPDNKTELTITADKSKYSWGDTIVFTINVKNVTNETLKGIRINSFARNYMKVSQQGDLPVISRLEPGETKTVQIEYYATKMVGFMAIFFPVIWIFNPLARIAYKEANFNYEYKVKVGATKYRIGFEVEYNVDDAEDASALTIKKTAKYFSVGEKNNTLGISVTSSNTISSAAIFLDGIKIADLTDDGDIVDNDDIANDGWFGARILVNTDKKYVYKYFVTAVFADGSEDSASFTIEIYEPLNNDEASSLLNIYDNSELKELENELKNAKTQQEITIAQDAIISYFKDLEKQGFISNVTVDSESNVINYYYLSVIKCSYRLETFEEGSFSMDGSKKQNQKYSNPMSTVAAQKNQSNTIGNKKALILSSFASNEDVTYIGSYRDMLLNRLNGYKSYGISTTIKYNATVEDYRNLLDDYGMIFINSHGTMLNNSPAICLSQECDIVNITKYSYDLWHGILEVYGGIGIVGARYAIGSNFIEFYHENTLPHSLVYSCICHGLENNDLANAFLQAGAATFTGFSDTVLCSYDRNILDTYTENLLLGKTTQESFNDAVKQHGASDGDSTPAFFTLRGDTDLKIIETGLFNGNFEQDNFIGWNREGDCRQITKLSDIQVVEGNKMAIISTGLGSISDSNSYIEQTFIVPDDANTITVNYDFVSEEPMEYVNSQYDDKLYISLIDKDENEHSLVSETVNKATWTYIGGDYFYDGDSTTYHTGWKEVDYNISKYRGQILTIKIHVYDIGDSKYDSAALVDNIYIH